MSRGLGALERFIIGQIAECEARDLAHVTTLTTWMLANDWFRPEDWCMTNPGLGNIFIASRSQRSSMIRAMKRIASKFPQFALAGGKGRKQLCLYDITDPVSVKWAELYVDNRNVTVRQAIAAHKASTPEQCDPITE